MNTTVIISLIVLVIVIVALVFLCIWFRSMAQTADDFLLAGRGAPFWLLAAAYLGGFVGGASVSGYVGYGYDSGISQMWASLWVVVGVMGFALLFVRRLNYFGRKTGAVTISDFLCARYGEKIRVPSAIVALMRPAIQTGMQFLAIATALTVIFGTSTTVGVIIAAAIIILYLITAGQFSALVTQWLQSILQSVGIIVFAVIAFKMIGNPTEVTEVFFEILPDSFTNIFSIDRGTFLTYLLTMGISYMVDPWGYMYAYMGKTPKATSNAMLSVMCGSYYNVLPFLSGMAILAGGLMGYFVVPDGLSNDGLYVWFTLNSANVFAGTVVLVGLLMTIISCGSAFSMNGVTIITRDIYQKVINKNATDKQTMRASRISVLIVAAIGIVMALWLPSLVPLWVLSQAIITSGLFAPVFSAWFWKRSTTKGAMASCIGGGCAAMAWAIYAWITTGSPGTLIGGFHAVHIGVIVSIPLMIIVSLCTKPDYTNVDKTSWVQLGKEMRAEESAEDQGKAKEKAKSKGIFGWLGAETKGWKCFWVLMGVLIIAHFVLALGFANMTIAAAFAWLAFGVCILMIFVMGIGGGRDLAGLVKANRKVRKEAKQGEKK